MTHRIPRRPWSRRRRQRKLRWRWAARMARYQWLSVSPPLVSAEVVELYKEVQPYGGSQDFASQLVTACREKDPSCTPTQVLEVVRSHPADIRGADNAIAWIYWQVPRFFEAGYQRPGDPRRETLEGQIRILRRLQK